MVVPKTPAPERNVALLPELAEIEAVGVPELTFKTANLAELVACPPTKKSRVLLIGYTAPLVTFHQLVPVEKPQLILFCRQRVPVASGKVMVRAAVAAEVRVMGEVCEP